MPSAAERYHEDTKYTPENVRRPGRGLDFDKQPVPFKDYATGTAYDLTRFLPEGEELKSDAELEAWRAQLPSADQDLAALSHLLYFTNGITAVIPYGGQPLLLRAAPSAGGLYPTELYVAVRDHAVLPDGLYNYQVRDHSLVCFWAHDPWPRLREATFHHPALEQSGLLVIATGVYFRSAWRYEDRAYRRILLDTGHVLGNLGLYAPVLGWQTQAIGGFADGAVEDLLFLDPEEEGVVAIAAVLPAGKPLTGPSALPGPVSTGVSVPEGRRLLALHAAGKLTEATPPPEAASGEEKYTFAFGETLADVPVPFDAQLGPTIIRRRSTRAYSGDGLTREELAALLGFTYGQSGGLFAPELLETFLAVHDVTGLDAGCYHYRPEKRELRQIRFTALRDEVQYLALGQDLAGRAGAVVFHTADLPRAVARYGDRVYRYLHLDAGHLGQRLNVAAIRLGLGVSGIGGFFDDQVNDMLGIPEREAVLYLTTLGRPESR
ncbi:MAG: SagB-type dehydrogenase domain protein [Cyanobacteria bacterium RYN_339]|nr:SagB-type dehydrogenase domain protein [Cyanobacteria bacterium RYN_339]